MLFAATWVDLEIVMLSEVSQTEKDKCHNDITYMWNLKGWYKRTCLQGRNGITDVGEHLVVAKGGTRGRDRLGDWD